MTKGQTTSQGASTKIVPSPGGSAPPPNRCTWLHGPTRVHNRNAISTGSDQVVVEAPRHKETVAGSTEDNAVTYMQIRGLTRPVVTGECLVGEPKHADSHPVNCVGKKAHLPPPAVYSRHHVDSMLDIAMSAVTTFCTHTPCRCFIARSTCQTSNDWIRRIMSESNVLLIRLFSIPLQFLNADKSRQDSSYKKFSYRRGTARCVVSVEILPTATQPCRNYLYDTSPEPSISCR